MTAGIAFPDARIAPTVPEQSTNSISKRTLFLAWLAMLILLAICDGNCVLNCYGQGDDYFHLQHALTVSPWDPTIVKFMVGQGRPFQVPFLCGPMTFIHYVSDLVWMRVASLILTSALGTAIFYWLRKANRSNVEAFAASAIAMAMPPFQVFLQWSILFVCPLTCLLGFGSAFFTERALGAPGPSPAPLHLFTLNRNTLIAIAFLCSSLFIYQPAAMIVWVFCAARLLSEPANKPNIHRLFTYAKVFFCACLVELAFFKGAQWFFGNDVAVNGRRGFTTHIVDKLQWFVQEPLSHALNLTNLSPDPIVACQTAAFLLIGLTAYFVTTKKNLLWAIPLLGFIPVTFLPNLAIAENSGAFRTQCSLVLLLIFYACFAIQGLLAALRSYKPLVISLVYLVSLTFCAYAAHRHVNDYTIRPEVLELKLIEVLSRAQPPLKEMEIFRRDLAIAPSAHFDEFGEPAGALFWVRQPMIDLCRAGRIQRP